MSDAAAASEPAPERRTPAPRDEPREPASGRGLFLLVAGLVTLAASNGMVQVTTAYRAQLEMIARSHRPPSIEALEQQLARAPAGEEADKLRARINDEVTRYGQRQATAVSELATADLDSAGTRYNAAWLAAIARCFVLLGAYGLARSPYRHQQIAGLAMLALFVYALTSDVRLTVG